MVEEPIIKICMLVGIEKEETKEDTGRGDEATSAEGSDPDLFDKTTSTAASG